jgi:alkylation response protein AidB-like acyl-CoA dehydrogenase
MTVTDEASDLRELRARVTAELKALLVERTPSSRSTVLGAGSNDRTPGQQFLQLLAPGGYMTPGWPAEYGGMGLDQAASDVVVDVRSGFEAPDLYPWMVGLDLVGPTILTHATVEQARRWLAPIRTGTEIWCQLFSEPDAGSDLANVKARAVRDGDAWRLNGSKVWTSRGHYSEWGLLLARTDGTVPKHRGITAFGLNLHLPGVTVRPLVQMNGDAHFNEVFFDDVVIPDDDRIGDPGDGWRVAITCLSHERGALAGGLGVSLDQLLALGRSAGVAGHAVRRDRLARVVTELQTGRWGGERALEARRAGAKPGPEGSLAKLATGRLIREVAGLGLESTGAAAMVVGDRADGDGVDDDGVDEWQTMWLVSPSLSIRGGTDEIQRNIVGERSLGLPPEPRLDKDRAFDDRPDR